MRVSGDAGAFHPGEHPHQRQLDPGHQPSRLLAVAGQLGVDRVGQVEGGPGLEHEVLLHLAVVAEPVEGELAGLRRVDPQLAVQVAQGQVGQVVGPLVGAGQVGGDLGVAEDALQAPAVRAERQHRRLAVVQHLGPPGVGQPGRQGRFVGRLQRGGVEPGRRAAGGGQRHPGHRGGVPPVGAGVELRRHTHRGAGRCVRLQPPGERPGHGEHLAGQVEAGLGLRLHRLQVLVEPVAQDAELKGVEDLVDRLAVPSLPARVLGAQRQLQVGDETVDLVVADHVGEPFAQAVTGLALDLVGPRDDPVDPAVQIDPLRGGLRADARDAGQVVAGLADQGGQVAVAVRGDAVLRLDRRRVHPGQVGDALTRV